MKDNKLVIKDVTLLFIEIKDADYGSSITIDATDAELQKTIEDFYAKEDIKPKFKDYTNKDSGETIKQFSIKLADFVSIKDENNNEYDLDSIETHKKEAKLLYGAKISIVIRAYEYENKFGKGKSSSVSALRILKGAEIKDDMEDLM